MRKQDLQEYIEFQKRITFVTRYQGWKLVEAYIRAKISEAEKAFHATAIETLSNEKIVRKLMSQRATVKALKDVLEFVYNKEAMKNALNELNIIDAIEQEQPEE